MAVTLPTYDSSKVSDLTISSASQSGSDVVGIYTESSSLNLTLLSTAGISVDFSTTNESERGLTLGMSRPFTNVTSDLAGTGESSNSWTLTIFTDLLSTSTISAIDPITLHVVNSPNPSVWSASNLPSTNLDTNQATTLLHIIDRDSSFLKRQGATTFNIVVPLDFLADGTYTVGSGTDANDTSGGVSRAPLGKIVNNGSWGGLIQFILVHPIALTTIVISFSSFTGKVSVPHTGNIGDPLDRRARSVHDYITGQTYLSDEAVADGYRHGIMVHPDNFDPVDPIEDDPFTPPPNEGVTDDEVIDLEQG